MASYNTRKFNGISSLIVEGIALSPEVQGKGIFSLLTKDALRSEKLVCLRTQNPRMYRALEKFCNETYPSKRETPEKIKLALKEFAEYTNSKPNNFGVVEGYYGGLFYGKEPTHCEVTRLFKEDLKMNLSKGDAVLAIGTIS